MVKLATRTKKDDMEDTIRTMSEKLSKLESAVVVDKPNDSGEGEGEGEKLSQTLKNIKNIKNKSVSVDTSNEEHDHSHSTDDIDCPTCKSGHVHKLKNDTSGLFKCAGPDCGKEFHLVSTTPDFQCIGCGTPIDKPTSEELANTYICPTCGKDHFQEFDKRKFKKIKT